MDNDSNPDNVTTDPTDTGGSLRRKGLAIGLTAGLLGGTAAGFAFGVPGLSSAASPGVVAQVDETEPVDAEAASGLRDLLQPLVDDGTITATQADAVTAHLQANRPERGERHGGPFGHGHGPLGRFLAESSDALTELLGIDEATLLQELRDGSSLAEIATANGVEVQTVIDTLVATATEQIDQSVADGEIDEARAEELKATLVERMTDRVNGVRPERPAHSEDDENPADTEAPTTTEG